MARRGVPEIALACAALLAAGGAWAQEQDRPWDRQTPSVADSNTTDPNDDEVRRQRPKTTDAELQGRIRALGDNTPTGTDPKPTSPATTPGTTTTGTDYGIGGGYKLDGGLGGYTTGGLKGYGGYGGLNYGGYDLPHTATTPEETTCAWEPDGGWLQPVQAVFQDDPVFPTATYDYSRAPQPNPLITQLGLGTLRADLPMVVGRDTVITGVARYWYRGKVEVGAPRVVIQLRGISDCESSVAVKVRFTLTDATGSRELHTTEVVGYAPVRGAPSGRPPQPFTIHVPVMDGLPPQSEGAFRIVKPGAYTIKAQAIDAATDQPIVGLEASVSGQAISTKAPVVEFIAVSLSGFTSASAANDFGSFVDDLTEATHRFLPDYFPLSPENLTTFSRDPVNLASFDPHLDDPTDNREALAAKITDRVGAAGTLSGAGRVIVVLRKGAQAVQDYGRAAPNDSAAFASSTKVIFLSVRNGIEAAGGIKGRGSTPNFEPAAPEPRPGLDRYGSSQVETVGHELNHTLPDLLWSSDADGRHNMVRDCGKDEHNLDIHSAYGVRIDTGGIESQRVWEDGSDSMMGAAVRPYDLWISQCAYAHLLASFPVAVDPKVMLVRAIVSRSKGKTTASLGASYDIDGVVDAEAGPGGDWAIEVRPTGGGAGKRYPFTPVWNTEDGYPRNTLAILAHIPEPAGAGALVVTYKGKTLVSRAFSASAPSLTVTSSANGQAAKGAKVDLSWTAAGAGGAPLLSSVFYSDNGGDFYRDQLFEGSANSWSVTLNPKAKDHVIKVMVTDQGRSSERLIRLTTP